MNPNRLTRRRALQLGGLTALATALRVAPPAVAAATPSHLRRSTYTGLSSRDFTAGGAPLRLVEVADLGPAALAGHEDAFLLAFSGSGLGQGIHTLTHPELGSFELFLVPAGPAGRHQAVIDRSVGAPAADEVPTTPPPAPPPAPPAGAPAAAAAAGAAAAPAKPTRKPAKRRAKRTPARRRKRR
jgi:hypothetical protein